MDNFWKYLIVANNLVALWLLYIVSRSDSNADLSIRVKSVTSKLSSLRDAFGITQQIDAQIIKETRNLIGANSERIARIEKEITRNNQDDKRDSEQHITH